MRILLQYGMLSCFEISLKMFFQLAELCNYCMPHVLNRQCTVIKQAFKFVNLCSNKKKNITSYHNVKKYQDHKL